MGPWAFYSRDNQWCFYYHSLFMSSSRRVDPVWIQKAPGKERISALSKGDGHGISVLWRNVVAAAIYTVMCQYIVRIVFCRACYITICFWRPRSGSRRLRQQPPPCRRCRTSPRHKVNQYVEFQLRRVSHTLSSLMMELLIFPFIGARTPFSARVPFRTCLTATAQGMPTKGN